MFLRLIKIITLIFLLSIFTSCQTIPKKMWTSEDLIVSEQATFASLAFPKSITSVQAAEDVDFLIFALSNAYGGRLYAPKDSFPKAVEKLKSISTTSTLTEFHNDIDEALFLIPDNHLMAYYNGKVSKKRQDDIASSVGRVGSNNISDPKKVWETRIDRLKNKKILYISIVRFPLKEDQVWNGFISSVSTLMKKADSIVIDLRGNSGGDDSKGMKLATVLFGHPFEHPIKRQYRSQTPETIALLTNRFAIPIINLEKQDSQKLLEPLMKDLNESKDRYNRSLKGQIPAEFIRTDKGLGNRADSITGYKKPIYILMDRSCGSSCEFTIAAFEWHSYAKKVGENTNGTFHFSNAGVTVLPNSKFKIIIPSQYSEYYDKRFIERIGLSADVKVVPGEDAYEATKKIISAE